MKSIYDEIYVARGRVWEFMLALIGVGILPSKYMTVLIFKDVNGEDSAMNNWHARYLKVLEKEKYD